MGFIIRRRFGDFLFKTETELLEPPEQQNQQNVSPLSSDEGLVLADGEEDLAALDGQDMDSDGSEPFNSQSR